MDGFSTFAERPEHGRSGRMTRIVASTGICGVNVFEVPPSP
jgi:hypothetical protein